MDNFDEATLDNEHRLDHWGKNPFEKSTKDNVNRTKKTKQSKNSKTERNDILKQPIITIKGYRENEFGEFICLDCGKVYKTKCTYNLHRKM